MVVLMATLTVCRSDVREINSEEELDRQLRTISRRACKRLPPIVSLDDVHEHHLDIGFWSGLAFIHTTSSSGLPPYFLTIGDQGDQGIIDFYSHGEHHTPIRRRHLIPEASARAAVIEFWNHGRRSSSVAWEQVRPE
jgi:hypothetical protein